MSTPWDITIYGTDGNPARISGSAVGQPPGGSTPGAARVLGPFPFAFDDVGLNDGVEFYTPTVGDILLDAWISVTEAFDGTTPLADFGPAVAGQGMFSYAYSEGKSDLSLGDYPNWASVSSLQTPVLSQLSALGNAYSLLKVPAIGAGGAAQQSLVALSTLGNGFYAPVPALFTGDAPLVVWASQDGTSGGTAVGGTAGAANVYLVVATPSLT